MISQGKSGIIGVSIQYEKSRAFVRQNMIICFEAYESEKGVTEILVEMHSVLHFRPVIGFNIVLMGFGMRTYRIIIVCDTSDN